VYWSPVIACFDGMVVSWSIGRRPNAELVNTMLNAAIDKVAVSGERPVVHSDCGGHYRWPGWLPRVSEAKLVRSKSHKGCSPDKAACEGFFGRLKTEVFFSRDWFSTSIEEFVTALGAYIRWYIGERIKSSLGFCSPIEHRKRLGIAVQPIQKTVRSPPVGQFDAIANMHSLALIIGSHQHRHCQVIKIVKPNRSTTRQPRTLGVGCSSVSPMRCLGQAASACRSKPVTWCSISGTSHP